MMESVFKVTRLYTDEDGDSVFQDLFVPMKDTNQATWESTEADENGMISTLSFCVPGRPDNNTTGHCPPASGCNT